MIHRALTYFLFICLLVGSFCYGDKEDLLPPRLVVRGEAKLFKPADQLELVLGVVTQDQDSQIALQANNKKMQQVINNLRNIGLDDEDFQTGQFYIQPIYKRPPREDQQDWAPSISHYEVKNTVQIRTQKLDLMAKIITATGEAGANKVDQIHFNLKDPQIFRAEAIALATKHALMDAQGLAESAHVRLVRVLSLSLDQAEPHPFIAPRAMMMKSDMSETPIEVGQVEIQASVHVIFEISS